MRAIRGIAYAVIAVGTLGLWSCSSTPAAATRSTPVADMKLLMEAMMDPAADVIWGSVGTIITLEGTEERSPKTDEEWMAVRNAAVTVAESGNLLTMPGRTKDEAEWTKETQAITEVAARIIKAADAHDRNAIFDLGAEMYGVCTSCHQQYVKEIRDGIPR
jgi:hypothetical protein